MKSFFVRTNSISNRSGAQVNTIWAQKFLRPFNWSQWIESMKSIEWHIRTHSYCSIYFNTRNTLTWIKGDKHANHNYLSKHTDELYGILQMCEWGLIMWMKCVSNTVLYVIQSCLGYVPVLKLECLNFFSSGQDFSNPNYTWNLNETIFRCKRRTTFIFSSIFFS